MQAEILYYLNFHTYSLYVPEKIVYNNITIQGKQSALTAVYRFF